MIIKNEDLIEKYNISKSDFISELPQLKDYSKITSSMRNNYAKQQYSEMDYINSLCQIRCQIAIWDLKWIKK